MGRAPSAGCSTKAPCLTNKKVQQNCANALIRFVANLRDRDNLDTYVYLRRHCQEGMLSRVKPSEFNVLHIALKQIIIKRVRAESRVADGAVREAVVPRSTSGA